MRTFNNIISQLMSTIQQDKKKLNELTTKMYKLYENINKQNEALTYIYKTSMLHIFCKKTTDIFWFPFS